MKRKAFTHEQTIWKLRDAEILLSEGAVHQAKVEALNSANHRAEAVKSVDSLTPPVPLKWGQFVDDMLFNIVNFWCLVHISVEGGH